MHGEKGHKFGQPSAVTERLRSAVHLHVAEHGDLDLWRGEFRAGRRLFPRRRDPASGVFLNVGKLGQVDPTDLRAVPEQERRLGLRARGKLPKTKGAVRARAAQQANARGLLTESDQLAQEPGQQGRSPMAARSHRAMAAGRAFMQRTVTSSRAPARSGTCLAPADGASGWSNATRTRRLEVGPPPGAELDRDLGDLHAHGRRLSFKDRRAQGAEIDQSPAAVLLGQGDESSPAGGACHCRGHRQGSDDARSRGIVSTSR